MDKFDSPAYILDFRDTFSCARLATLIKAKPGQEKEMEIYVRRADDQTRTLTKAQATRTTDPKTLNVVVTTAGGQPSFIADCDQVMREMSAVHPKRSW